MVKTFKLTKVLCLVLAAVLLAFSLTACGGAESTTLEGAKIKVGTSGLFGPFSYFDADGKLIGYDIDLLNKLQEMLGFEYEGGTIQDMEYSALTTSLTT
ncbi:MAG: transporter substrate-binding domain-containing protein, partial [Oscillospiraceae bacterium]|nr:transporter substrate-binding domain-containing protein [Oscillospiraceae bacterium]